MTLDQRRRLRELLANPGPVIAPGVYDSLTGRIVERAGFDVAMVSGAGVAASVLGVPDLGLISMTESLNQTRNIASAISIPLIADCDAGYGNPVNVRRTIQEFEATGVAAIFIEDQVTPKRCGHFDGKQVISADDMVQKIRAAVEARTDRDMVIVARTDAREVDGPEEAIRRGRRYLDAGAEMIFVEAPHTSDELRLIARELGSSNSPLMVNLVEGGLTPLLPVDQLARMGFKLISFSGSLQKAAIHAMQELLAALNATGEVSEFYPGRMVSLQERSEILGLPGFIELEQRYGTGGYAGPGRPA